MLKTSEALPTILEVARDSRRMRRLIFRVETEDIIPQDPTLWGRNPNTFKRVSDTPIYAFNPQKSRHCQAKNDIGVSVSVSKTIVLVSGIAYNADDAYDAYTAEGG